MKTLKFNHKIAEQIRAGNKTSTWRLYDDKDISINDDIKIIDKVSAEDSKSWQVIGHAKVKQIIEKALGSVTDEEMRLEGLPSSREDMIRVYRAYYGNRVNQDTPLKIITFDFVPATNEEPSAAMLLETAKLYTDGGSRGNPGDSACAFVICNMEDNVVEKAGFYLGVATNNQAEYYGVKKGLERALELGIGRVSLFSDSQLVVNQLNGLYKVKNPELAPLYQEVGSLAESFEKISFVHVPRELNKTADGEVNRILDEQAGRK